MKLADLQFVKQGDEWARATIRLTTDKIMLARAESDICHGRNGMYPKGNFYITHDRDGERIADWSNVDALTAQSILYHLLENSNGKSEAEDQS